NEEPSLVPLAIDLISLGLDGAPLIKAFAKGVALRNLIRAGEDLKSAKVRTIVNELNDIDKTKAPRLGEKTLADVRAAEHEGGAAGQAATAARRPVGSAWESADKVRREVRGEIERLVTNGKNPEWTDLWHDVDRKQLLAQHPQNKELLDLVDNVHALALDQKV